MPRYFDSTKNYEINTKSQDNLSIYDVKFHVSTSLDESKIWFDNQKKLLRAKGGLFEDPFFPANDSSIFYSQPPSRKIEWKRPKEICQNPQFISAGLSRFDVVQGDLGDCWLLAAVASLSMYPQLMNQVIPEDQDFQNDYVGAFMFRLWQFGTWYDIVVDDRLPTSNKRLVYMHSSDLNEFWSALSEKAYAKISGSYEALKDGSSSEAMEDFTGGFTELFHLGKSTPSNLWDIMLKGVNRSSLMGCSIEADPNVVEAKAEKGLIKGHAYSITDVRPVKSKSGQVNLVRVRNPWGNSCEWTGAYSDKSPEWNNISDVERKRLGLTFEDDGEFWMTFDDFSKYFTKLEICHLSPESELESKSGVKKTRWELCVENGDWQENVSAGGCRNFRETFHLNPQFKVDVIDPDEHDNDNKGTLVIGLMQKGMRERRKEGKELFSIGYEIYKMKDDSYDYSVLNTKYFRTTDPYVKSPAYIKFREVCGRHKLPVGKYVIVPSTFNPGEEAKFLLRIFSERACDSIRLDKKTEVFAPIKGLNLFDREQPGPITLDESSNAHGLEFEEIEGKREKNKNLEPTYDDIIEKTKELRKEYPNENKKVAGELKKYIEEKYNRGWGIIIIRGQYWAHYSYIPKDNFVFKLDNDTHVIFRCMSD